MVFALATTAFAVDTDTSASGINLIKGTWLSEPSGIANNGLISPQATTVPTSLAPSSWYNTYHYWTAAANGYTWSSYIFDYTIHNGLIVYSPMPFTLTWYTSAGTVIGTSAADQYPDGYYIQSYIYHNYYIKISNPNSTAVTLSSSAYYIAY